MVSPVCGSSIDNISLVFKDVVPDLLCQTTKNHLLLPMNEDILLNSEVDLYPLVKTEDCIVSYLEKFRTKLSDKGVSKGASHLVVACRRDCANKNYLLSCKK